MIKIVMHDVDYSPENPSLDIIDKYFDGDWRRGKEIHRVTITNRLYQISPGKTKAWFSNGNKQHRCCRQIFNIAHGCQKFCHRILKIVTNILVQCWNSPKKVRFKNQNGHSYEFKSTVTTQKFFYSTQVDDNHIDICNRHMICCIIIFPMIKVILLMSLSHDKILFHMLFGAFHDTPWIKSIWDCNNLIKKIQYPIFMRNG